VSSKPTFEAAMDGLAFCGFADIRMAAWRLYARHSMDKKGVMQLYNEIFVDLGSLSVFGLFRVY
jgi:hypothetical protein